MEYEIMDFASRFGWQLTLIAVSGIFVLGILKFFKVFHFVEKAKRKYIYAAVSAGLSILASAIYLSVLGKFTWLAFGVLIMPTWAFNQFAYSIYENTGIRAGMQKLGLLVVESIAKKHIEDVKKKLESQESEEPKTNNLL